jgi:hypothetical protein
LPHNQHTGASLRVPMLPEHDEFRNNYAKRIWSGQWSP